MFQLKFVSDGHVPAFEYHVCGGITPKLGMALDVAGGKLATATGSVKPRYISMLESDSDRDGEVIPVIRVEEGILFAVPCAASFAAVKPGDRVMIGSDGLTVTAATGGKAEVVVFESAEAGAEITVRFDGQ